MIKIDELVKSLQGRHSRERGSPEVADFPGFPHSREWRKRMISDFLRVCQDYESKIVPERGFRSGTDWKAAQKGSIISCVAWSQDSSPEGKMLTTPAVCVNSEFQRAIPARGGLPNKILEHMATG